MVGPAHSFLPPGDLRRLYGRRVTSAISTLGAKHALVQQVLKAQGFQDGAALVALDASRRGVNLAVLTPQPVVMSARDKGLLERLGAHAAAAWRLRSAYADSEREKAADAIVDGNGRLQYAAEPAKAPETRDRLRDFARVVDRARTAKRRKDPAAVTAWTALVEGRWSMVDHFDSDGRRFCIFLRNDPTLEHLRPLTTVQRQVVALAALGLPNKLIAYELGLSSSRVATDLRRGIRKLGVANRVELIRLFGFLDPEWAK
jgi:DNA-binding CsgD family transcriptional regulator